MRFLSRRRRVVVLVPVLFALAGGIAYASIPDSSGVIHGCYNKSSGTLNVIDSSLTKSCPSGYLPLNWSQSGPTGPRGPSDAYLASDPGESIGFDTTILSTTLPAGSYTLIAKTGVYNLGFADIIDCMLKSGTATLDNDTVRLDGADINNDNEFLDLIGTTTLASSQTISIVCSDLESTGAAASENAQLLATEVATLH